MFQAGDEIAGYRIERLVGRGGMGVVYEATQLSLDRTVALKVLTPEVTDDHAFRARFRREGRIQARIDHSHIVSIHEAGEAEQGLFLAMRYVKGPTLKAMILARELDPARALRILSPIADALDAAHEVGLVHRDVKPQNILVAAGDHPYLADFGLTKSAAETAITGSGSFIGTLDYIAPEQIRAEEATARSDVYSFGAVLYEALTGVVPFPMQSQAAVIYAHMTAPPPRMRDQRPELPEALDRVVAKALAKEPEHRQHAVGELMRDALAAFEGAGSRVIAPPAPLERAQDTGIRPDESTVPTAEAVADSHTTDMPATGERSLQIPRAARPQRAAGSVPRWLAATLLLTLAAIGAAAGAIIGHSARSGRPPQPRSFVAAGDISLSPAGAWRSVSSPDIPGLALREAVTLSDGSASSEGLEVGTTDATGDPLLPVAFLRQLVAQPRADTVRLGRYAAYRYAPVLKGRGGRALTVFTVPTDHGVATAVCFSSGPGQGAFMARCAHAATTIELRGVRPFAVGPDPAFAARLNRVLTATGSAGVAGRRRLSGATSAAAQATAAADLGNLFARAARDLPTRNVSPELAPASRAIVSTLSRTSAAYRALAAAARRRDRRAYHAAATAVAASDRAVLRALGQLRALGYQTSG